MTRFCGLICCVALLGSAWGCAKQTAPDTREADARAVRESEIEASNALGAKDLARLVSFYADDASLFFPNTPIVTGKDAIRQTWKTILAIPNFAMSFQIVKVEVSRSGDLAYGHGTYTRTWNDAAGQAGNRQGQVRHRVQEATGRQVEGCSRHRQLRSPGVGHFCKVGRRGSRHEVSIVFQGGPSSKVIHASS
jgi:ketosteroid isomerase-like protein